MIDSKVDVNRLDVLNVSDDDMKLLDFVDLEVTYEFFRWYGRIVGFSIHKIHLIQINRGNIATNIPLFMCWS